MGDTLNIWYIINQEFFMAANRVFNPRNSMYISRNDGLFDNRLNHQRDVIINSNTFVSYTMGNYFNISYIIIFTLWI